jgi:anti-anti-sigma factor
MEIAVSQAQGRVPVTVFRLKGDLANEQPLESTARQAYESGTRYLLLDLSDVPFISSAGLRALHVIYTMLRQKQGEESDRAVQEGIRAGTYRSPHLKLLKPSRNARRALSVAGYDMFLEIHEEYNQAIAAF